MGLILSLHGHNFDDLVPVGVSERHKNIELIPFHRFQCPFTCPVFTILYVYT